MLLLVSSLRLTLPTQSDKHVQRKSLAFFYKMPRFNSNIVDQWDLVLCGCAAVRHTRDHPEIWEGSFIAVNLHPNHQVPFEEWCKKIAPFMQASDSFY